MADKKFLLENNLMEAYKNFMHLCNETTYFSGSLDEEGEDDPQQGGDMGGGQDMASGGPNAMPQDGSQDMQQGQDMQAPDAQGGGDMSQFDPNAQGQDMNAAPQQEDPNMGMQDMGMEQPMGEEEVEDEEVIDVEDITNAQEKTNAKVNKVGRNLGKVDDKMIAIMDTIKSLQAMIDDNNAKIEAFKTEFEKRNPTPTEKMNLRSLDSYPFNENPTKYWSDKAHQPEVSGNRYEAYADNEEPVAKKEYVITNDDVDDYTQNAIKDSFYIDDNLRSTIERIFDL